MSAENYIKRVEGLFSSTEFVNNQTLSQDVASLFIPRRSEIQSQKGKGTTEGWYDFIYEPAPIETAKILTQGQYDLLFTGKWFETQAPRSADGNVPHERKVAYSKVGERMLEVIQRSNFKLEIQEFLADRSTVHTSLILCEGDEEDTVFFTQLPPGQYAIAENHKKRVDMVARKFKLTARQAKQKFNKETDKLGPKVLEAYGNPAKQDERFEFCQIIEPRLKGAVDGSQNPKEKPWASVYVCIDDRSLVRESGYDEQPFMCSRFERWGDSPYGTGPAHMELARARGLQKMKQTWLALGDRHTSPGIFVAPDQEEDVDLYGTTVVSLESAAAGLPREWRYSGDYNLSLDAIEREIRKMEESFHVPLFKLLTSDMEQRREKTAFEVAKMLEEQVGKANPTFSRLDEEVTKPILNRIFGIMARDGEFDDLLENLVLTVDGEGARIELPEIVFTSKLAQASKITQSNGYLQFLNTLSYVIDHKPETLDNTNWDLVWRRLWKDTGLPIEDLFSEDDVKQTREVQAQMAQASIALQQGNEASQIAKNVGSIAR